MAWARGREPAVTLSSSETGDAAAPAAVHGSLQEIAAVPPIGCAPFSWRDITCSARRQLPRAIAILAFAPPAILAAFAEEAP